MTTARPKDSDASKTRSLIEFSTEMAGGAVGGALGMFLTGPGGAALGGAGGVAITKAFMHVGNEIHDRFLAPREKLRVGAALAVAADTTSRRLGSGEAPRQDDFVDDGTDHPPIEQITEGLLQAAQRAYDEKRVPYIGRISGNLNFRPDLGVAAASWLTRLADDVSYTQLCMLRLAMENVHGAPLTGGKVIDKRTRGAAHAAYLSEALELSRLGLLNFGDAVVWSLLDVDPPRMRLQGYGVHLYELMELKRIPEVDLAPIRTAFA